MGVLVDGEPEGQTRLALHIFRGMTPERLLMEGAFRRWILAMSRFRAIATNRTSPSMERGAEPHRRVAGRRQSYFLKGRVS